ncbi:MAG: hypothetical protein U9Q78_02425 [Chloroflexota bacterium]|nr:hypothetical protein [Chloroflexota bacterium]
MELLTGQLTREPVFRWALFTAIEAVLENAVTAAWRGAAGQLKPRFLRWVGEDQEGQRRAAFARAAEVARANTLRYAADPQQAERILDTLDSERDPVQRRDRVKLYDKCVTALVDTWEKVKGLTLEERQRDFYRYRRRLLERLAYELHTQAEEPGQLQTVKRGDLELLLTRFLMENRRLGFADDPDGAREEARAFIRLARGRTGLLVERGQGVFGFSHLTFQEYLAACDVENRCIHRGVEAIWKEIEGRLHDPHWREVILLLLGSLNEYDEPPTLLVERILETGEEGKFESVLHRHLYLAARALADRVDVATDLHRDVVDELLRIARTAPSWERGDALTTLAWLEGDDYAADSLLALARDESVAEGVRFDAYQSLKALVGGTVG